jgi:hypothetical protein
MKNTIVTIVGTGLVVAGLLFAFEHRAAPSSQLGEINRFTSTTVASSTCETTSSDMLATSSGRLYAAFVNDSSTTTYLGFTNPAVAGKGVRLNANGGSYEINLDNLFTGAVSCISLAAGSNITVMYK